MLRQFPNLRRLRPRFHELSFRTFVRHLPSYGIRTIQLLAALHLCVDSIAEIRPCRGVSMLPTLSYDRDWLLVSPLPYWALWNRSPPRWGDLVYATSPNDPSNTVCKRIIGLEGDIIERDPRRGPGDWQPERVREEEGDRGLHEEREEQSAETRVLTTRVGHGQWIKIPKGHVWLAGDNISNSTDSRMYGPVPLALVKGKVLMRISRPFRTFTNPAQLLDGPKVT